MAFYTLAVDPKSGNIIKLIKGASGRNYVAADLP